MGCAEFSENARAKFLGFWWMRQQTVGTRTFRRAGCMRYSRGWLQTDYSKPLVLAIYWFYPF